MNNTAAVMLLGGLRRSALEAATECVPALLPLSESTSLLGAWLDVLRDFGCDELRIVTAGGRSDADIDAELARCDALSAAAPTPDGPLRRLPASRMTERASHRGTGGLLRDTAADLPMAEWILFIEPHCAPPRSLAPLAEVVRSGDAREGSGRDATRTCMAVGVARGGAPAGACLMRRELLEFVPRIGYFDFKEQFLPLVAGRGLLVRPATIDAEGIRVHDLEAYRAVVARWLGGSGPSISADAKIEPGARVLGSSVVMGGTRIGEDAIVQDSVVLAGAYVGSGAVIARGLIPSGYRVAPRSLVVDRVLDPDSSGEADRLISVGPRQRPPEADEERSRT